MGLRLNYSLRIAELLLLIGFQVSACFYYWDYSFPRPLLFSEKVALATHTRTHACVWPIKPQGVSVKKFDQSCIRQWRFSSMSRRRCASSTLLPTACRACSTTSRGWLVDSLAQSRKVERQP